MDLTTTIALVVCIVVLAGVLSTRLLHIQKERKLVRNKLEAMFEDTVAPVADFASLNAEREQSRFSSTPLFEHIAYITTVSGAKISPTTLCVLTVALVLVPTLLAVVIDGPLLIVGVVSLIASILPYVILRALAEKQRTKFVQQLPDAIDLMISVLRCGLSVPQAIKSIGDEMPAPIGPEFVEVLHRINLGQSLSESLSYTVDKYKVFELDLVRRAAAIQLEVGGSLADLFEKTNGTLRQRIKLKRTVEVLTASSRLSGTIIAILPFVIITFFYFANPAYLDPLFTTNIGKILLVLSFSFQVGGIFIIRRMASFKV